MNFKKIILVLCLLSIIISCKKKEIEDKSTTSEQLKNGILVLNEGLFQLNNSTLSWIDLSNGVVNNSIFEQKTGRQLGDTGNDMIRYGNKVYVVVNVSSTIEILDTQTLKPIKQLSVTNNGVSQQPRFMTPLDGTVYISTFGGEVWCIDTTSLSIANKIPVGLNPDQITNDGQNIYVSNSGGLNSNTYDSTVSVINNQHEIKKIVVGKNPGTIIVGGDQNLYVIVRGNYNDIPAKICRINRQTLEVDQTFAIQATDLINLNSNSLLIETQQNGMSSILKFNLSTQQIENQNFINTSNLTTIYKMQFDAVKQHIYLFDVNNYTNTGSINVFSSNGNFIKKYQVGLNPSKLIVYP